MSDFLLHLRLDDVRNLLNSGHPPIIIQLLCVNTLLMIIFMYRRMRKRGAIAKHSSNIVQWLLIFASFAVVCEEQWLPYVIRSESSMVEHVGQVFRPY